MRRVIKASNESLEQFQSALLELRLFTEAFYFFAGRLRELFGHKGNPFPGLRSFEAPGVRDVRNHLIQHPEGKHSQAFLWSLGYGGPGGPYIKFGSPGPSRKFRVRGLYTNAEEFRKNLELALLAAVKRKAE